MTNLFEDDVKIIRFLADYRGILTSENFFTSGTIVDTAGATTKIDHAGLVEAERAEYVEGEELGDSWIFDPSKIVEVIEEEEEAEEAEIKVMAVDLEDKKVKDLKAIAKELEIKGYSKLKRDELVEAILKAEG